jgi:hypothetical protein
MDRQLIAYLLIGLLVAAAAVSDEPPDYIDWGNGRPGSSILGCLAGAIGGLFMLTGGLCVFAGVSGSGTQLLIGLLLLVFGWVLSRSGR